MRKFYQSPLSHPQIKLSLLLAAEWVPGTTYSSQAKLRNQLGTAAMLDTAFSTVDFIIFALVLVLSFGIGIYHSFKHSANNEEYLMGGRTMGIIPMAISLCASFNSAFMILGKAVFKVCHIKRIKWFLLSRALNVLFIVLKGIPSIRQAVGEYTSLNSSKDASLCLQISQCYGFELECNGCAFEWDRCYEMWILCN